LPIGGEFQKGSHQGIASAMPTQLSDETGF